MAREKQAKEKFPPPSSPHPFWENKDIVDLDKWNLLDAKTVKAFPHWPVNSLARNIGSKNSNISELRQFLA